MARTSHKEVQVPVADAVDTLLSLARPDALRDPAPIYGELRKHHPAFWHDELGSWFFSGYGDCAAVLKDTARFASDWRRLGEDTPDSAISLQTLDPPAHTAVRHLMVGAFRSTDQAALERSVGRRAERRLAELAARGDFDFVTEFAEPIALATTLELLGAPEPEPDRFQRLSAAIVDGMDAGIWPELAAPATAARTALAELTGAWLAAAEGSGTLAYLAGRDRDGIDPGVVHNTLRVLLHAGYASSSKLLALACVTLLDEPGGLARFAASPATAADELMRYESPVRAVARGCVAGTRVGGITVRAGEAVTLLLGAANRDPDRFADPDTPHLDRAPNPHLGFGRGPHSCLGAALAGMQARAVFTALAHGHPGARATAPPVYRRNLTLRGLSSFRIALS